MIKKILALSALSLANSIYAQNATHADSNTDLPRPTANSTIVSNSSISASPVTVAEDFVKQSTAELFSTVENFLCTIIPNPLECDAAKMGLAVASEVVTSLETLIEKKLTPTELAEIGTFLKTAHIDIIAKFLSKVQAFIHVGEEDLQKFILNVANPEMRNTVEIIFSHAKMYVETGLDRVITKAEAIENNLAHCFLSSVKGNITIGAIFNEVKLVEGEAVSIGQKIKAGFKNFGEKVKQFFTMNASCLKANKR
ncbi:MAG: hypothetical protein K2X39_07905 [Silvanigrellaceae bacterium]|nr:hypothetical protein [Silvanigrellaceae bacterium]